MDQGTNFRGLKIQDKKLVSGTRIECQGVRRTVAEDPAVELVSPDGISHGGVGREVLLVRRLLAVTMLGDWPSNGGRCLGRGPGRRCGRGGEHRLRKPQLACGVGSRSPQVVGAADAEATRG